MKKTFIAAAGKPGEDDFIATADEYVSYSVAE